MRYRRSEGNTVLQSLSNLRTFVRRHIIFLSLMCLLTTYIGSVTIYYGFYATKRDSPDRPLNAAPQDIVDDFMKNSQRMTDRNSKENRVDIHAAAAAAAVDGVRSDNDGNSQSQSQPSQINNNKAISVVDKVKNAKKVLITYGQNCCEKAKQRMCESGFENGNIDYCYAYDASVMDAQFTEKNAHILNQGRGAGYWLWKPYILYKQLIDPNLPDGSYIIYSDAGAKVIGDVAHVLNFMEERDDFYNGVLFFGVGFKQSKFCKRDAFILQDCDREECYEAMQINAFVAFMRKDDYSRMVIKTWLDACEDDRILTDKGNTLGKPNLGGFRDHRHDQAVITNTMIANGWNYDTTNGPVLDKVFHHDRYKS